jgi:hypothetical protein
MAIAAILDLRLSRFRWHFRTLLDGTVLWSKIEQNRFINTVVMSIIGFQDGVRRHLVFSFIPFPMEFSNTASRYGAMVKI